MKTILRLLFFLKPFTQMVLISIVTGTVTIICGIGLLGASAYLLSMAALQPSISVLQVSIVGVRFFGLSRGIFRYLERLSSHTVNLQVLSLLRVWFYRALEPLAPARLLEFSSGDVLARAVGDIETLENFYVRVFAPVVTAIVITIGMGFFIGVYDPSLGWVLVLGLLTGELVLPVGHLLISKPIGRKWIESRARLSSQMVEFTQGLGELTILNVEQQKLNQILRIGDEMGKTQIQLSRWSGMVNGLLVMVNGLTIWVMLRIAIPMVQNGDLDGVSLAVLILSSIASFEVTAPLITASGLMEASLRAAQRLFKLVDVQPAVVEATQPQAIPQDSQLDIRNVCFAYTMDEESALNDFSLKLKAGQRIAIVGESGAGKTTLINLLLRFWQKDSGQIMLGGVEIEDMKLEDVRSRFSLISSTGWVFKGSIFQNLRIAKNFCTVDECWKAIGRAGLSEWVKGLPNGLETMIGERGMNISGGERQRLMVARAVLQDAPIVLLDEPTSGLDALSEQVVLRTLFEITQNKSSIWIMHRMMGLEKMDEIIVLSEGRVVERGSYETLMEKQGQFWKMIKLQQEVLVEH